MAEEKTTYKLTYFGMAGRAGAARAMFRHAKVDFENEHIAFGDWKGIKPTTTWGNLPYLTVNDDVIISQSRAMTRYVAKVCGLYPEDFALAAHCDALHDVFEDFGTTVMKLNGPGASSDEKTAARQADVELGLEGSKILGLYKRIDDFLGLHGATDSNGHVHAVGTEFTVADFVCYVFIHSNWCGFYDGLEMKMIEDAGFDNVLAVYNSMAKLNLDTV